MQRRIAIDFDKVPRLHQGANPFPVCQKRRNKGGKDNDAGIHKQFGGLTDTPNIFLSVLLAESEIRTQSVPHIVAIKQIGSVSSMKKNLLHAAGQRRLSCSG
jgi:hypothetical protein